MLAAVVAVLIIPAGTAGTAAAELVQATGMLELRALPTLAAAAVVGGSIVVAPAVLADPEL